MKKLVAIATLFALPAFADTNQGYSLKVEAPTSTKKGQKVVAKVLITPAAGFHMNKEYPTSLTINNVPAGVTVEKMKWTMKDAAKWEEQGGEFDVPVVSAEAGKKVVTGELKFAVCSTNTCDPKKSAVSIEIDAK